MYSIRAMLRNIYSMYFFVDAMPNESNYLWTIGSVHFIHMIFIYVILYQCINRMQQSERNNT